MGGSRTGAVRTVTRSVSPSDEELVGRMQSGDTEALGALYGRHHVRAQRVAQAICRDTGRAQEAVQEAFISIWRSRGTYQPLRGDVGGWTMTIVHNRAIDVARRNGAIENRRTDVAMLRPVAASVDVVAEVERRDRDNSLRVALGRLPAAQREVIGLAFFAGLSHDEIAGRLGLPTGTVKGRARLGLQKLRRDFVRE